MKTLSSLLLSKPTRLAVPAFAALAVLGGAAAPASASPAPAAHQTAAAKFTWHSLKLLNNWESASSSSSVTGTPAWASRDGVVYLRGAIKNLTAGSELVAILPASARPAHDLYAEIATSGDVPGSIWIQADGVISIFGGNANGFASLASVSYPLGSVPSHKLTLENGWQSEDSQFQTGDPAYSIRHGVVYLTGSLAKGKYGRAAAYLPKAARPKHIMYLLAYTADGNLGVHDLYPNGKIVAIGADATSYTSLANISYPVTGTKWHNFNLPAAARPARVMNILVYNLDGIPGWLLIYPDGSVLLNGSDATNFTSLAGVSFPASGAKWHKFSLRHDWISGYRNFQTASPAYAVINGVVYLNGSLTQTAISSGVWANLPAAARPADTLQIETDVANGFTGAVTLTRRQAHAYS